MELSQAKQDGRNRAPRLGLEQVTTHWNEIAMALAECNA